MDFYTCVTAVKKPLGNIKLCIIVQFYNPIHRVLVVKSPLVNTINTYVTLPWGEKKERKNVTLIILCMEPVF